MITEKKLEELEAGKYDIITYYIGDGYVDIYLSYKGGSIKVKTSNRRVMFLINRYYTKINGYVDDIVLQLEVIEELVEGADEMSIKDTNLFIKHAYVL